MSGLIVKDLLVLDRRVNGFYKLLCVVVLVGVVVLLPDSGAMYIGVLLPPMGVGFLTELINVEEK